MPGPPATPRSSSTRSMMSQQRSISASGAFLESGLEVRSSLRTRSSRKSRLAGRRPVFISLQSISSSSAISGDCPLPGLYSPSAMSMSLISAPARFVCWPRISVISDALESVSEMKSSSSTSPAASREVLLHSSTWVSLPYHERVWLSSREKTQRSMNLSSSGFAVLQTNFTASSNPTSLMFGSFSLSASVARLLTPLTMVQSASVRFLASPPSASFCTPATRAIAVCTMDSKSITRFISRPLCMISVGVSWARSRYWRKSRFITLRPPAP